MPMDALLSVALKVSTLPDKDREWIYRHLSKRQASLLKEKTQAISKFKMSKKLSHKDIFDYGRSKSPQENRESANRSDISLNITDTHESSNVFSVLDQYQKKSVIKAFEQLPAVIVASYLSSGDKKWLDVFGSHAINGHLIDYRALALTQKVPRATAREVANIIYEKSELLEKKAD